MQNFEKHILKHVHKNLEEKYIEALVDYHTNLLNDDVPTVLGQMFNNCGKADSEEVSQKNQNSCPCHSNQQTRQLFSQNQLISHASWLNKPTSLRPTIRSYQKVCH